MGAGSVELHVGRPDHTDPGEDLVLEAVAVVEGKAAEHVARLVGQYHLGHEPVRRHEGRVVLAEADDAVLAEEGLHRRLHAEGDG
ncbi:MAG: hypothetical protein R3D28_04300 [Geminicoccaceae bacterium]